MTSLQQRIIAELGVRPAIDPDAEIETRVRFLTEYLRATGARGFVLGVSGGQDSTLAGRLCRLAIDAVRTTDPEGGHLLVAARLPHGVQADEDDARAATEFIAPDHTATIDIAPATGALSEAVAASIADVPGGGDGELGDFVRGNVKARQRMVAVYAIAGQLGLLVVGSDHAAEEVTGFSTKFGDAAADVMPLAGLSKRQGAEMLAALGADPRFSAKVPTADLEDDRPGLPDEEALGVTYAEIDDYLAGATVSAAAAARIERLYAVSEHKRHRPPGPADTWWRS